MIGHFIKYHPYPELDERTATALFIYNNIYFRSPDSPNFGGYIKWLKNIKVKGPWSLLLAFMSVQEYRQDIRPPYDNFYSELKILLYNSPLWDWVIPHLRETYPNKNFMEVYNETI